MLQLGKTRGDISQPSCVNTLVLQHPVPTLMLGDVKTILGAQRPRIIDVEQMHKCTLHDK